MGERTMRVNAFEVSFHDGGYPRLVSIKYDGKELVRVHHQEVKDLEYCLGRIRDELRDSLHTNEKHEA